MKDGKKKPRKNLKDNMWKTFIDIIKIIFILFIFIAWVGCLFDYFSIDTVEDYLILLLGTGIGFLITFLWISISKKY